MTPLQKYNQDLVENNLLHDPSQELVIHHLQDLYDDLLIHQHSSDRKNQFRRFYHKVFTASERSPVKGLYLWGGVGRGKTYLMDIFFDSLPFEQKMRTHFYRFMQRVHNELRHLKGTKNPLIKVAQCLSAENRIICFDEFFVVDIADAMILRELFHKLFSQGVTLVATSNIVPDNLYKDGLQRQQFLPVIKMLHQYTKVVEIKGTVDYRLSRLTQVQLYHYPLNGAVHEKLLKSFRTLVVASDVIEKAVIEINGRAFLSHYQGGDVIWFDFTELCDKPRSQYDYIELAKMFRTVIISNLPVLTMNDQVRRFIQLVDEFYNCKVKLILSAAAPLIDIYQGELLKFEFARVYSRLIEMQSQKYLARGHKP